MSAARTCSVSPCDRHSHARGWCVKHYNRWQRTGDPLGTRPLGRSCDDEFTRFWSKVEEAPDGCWLWTAGVNADGYGVFGALPRRDGRLTSVGAHRHAYKQMRGPVPDDLHLDHLCRVRACVNPEHLEPVTPLINTMRGVGLGSRNASKTHCPAGHPFEGENLIIQEGRRMCRACRRESDRRRRAKGAKR